MKWRTTILFGGFTLGAIAGEAPAPFPPNFVVIMTEAQGWANTSVPMDEGNPGSKSAFFKTPAVERLAREGMRFANGYAASPRCTPSRAALFTGKNPAELHMTFVGGGRESTFSRSGSALIPPEPLLELPAGVPTIGTQLQAAGYATAHFGKWHVGRVSPARHGFDESDGPTSNGGPDNVHSPNPTQAVGLTERGIAFMQRAANAGRPFYLQLSHYPDQPQHGGGGRRNRDSTTASDVVDQTVSRVLDAIDRLGLASTTYVIYTSDHGAPGRSANEPLSGGKGSLREGGVRVPFLVRGPGIAAGVCSHVPVMATDILPTLAEFAGVKARLPAGLEGGSLAGVLRDPAGAGTVQRARPELVFHFPHYDHDNGGPASAIIIGSLKLIRVYETGDRHLFDVAADPSEHHDLARSQPDNVAELDARLTAYLKAMTAQMAAPNPDYRRGQSSGSAAPADPHGGRRS